ncbi:MAG: hypothetical protein WC558_06635 [Patulibacter sp.]
MEDEQIAYDTLVGPSPFDPESWASAVQTALVPHWMDAYRAVTPWTPEVMEIRQGALTYLFDGAPTFDGETTSGFDDRVVAVWGSSCRPVHRRDRGRLAGFIPNPRSWSVRQRDRGHFVSHAAGGGLDLNLFPQHAALNRGRSEDGRRWRRMERLIASRPGTPLFVRPIYRDPTWTPALLEIGFWRDGALRWERVLNSS